MKSIEERLADSNPVTQQYVPANYEQMVARAMRHSRPVDSVWRAFRLRMAGSVAAASALTVLGVSALNGAGALPVLGFSAAGSHGPSASSVKAVPGAIQGTMMPVMLNYTFTGAENFSSTAGSAPVYALSAPGDLATTLASVASALGITLATTVDAGNSSSYYGVSGTGYSGTIYNNGGSDYWNIDATPNGVTGASGSTGSTGTVVPVPTTGSTGASGATGATGCDWRHWRHGNHEYDWSDGFEWSHRFDRASHRDRIIGGSVAGIRPGTRRLQRRHRDAERERGRYDHHGAAAHQRVPLGHERLVQLRE